MTIPELQQIVRERVWWRDRVLPALVAMAIGALVGTMIALNMR